MRRCAYRSGRWCLGRLGRVVAGGMNSSGWLRARGVPLLFLQGRFSSLHRQTSLRRVPQRGELPAHRFGWIWKVGVLAWLIAAWSAPSLHLRVTPPQPLVTLAQPDAASWLSVKPIVPLRTPVTRSSGRRDAGEVDAREQEEMMELLESRYFEKLPDVPDQEMDDVPDSR